MKDKKTLMYLAGACFAVLVIITLSGGLTANNIINALGYLLLAVGLFVCIPSVSAIGCGVNLAYLLFLFIRYVVLYGKVPTIITYLLGFVSFVMLLIACLNRKNGLICGIIAAVTRIVHLVYVFIMYNNGASIKINRSIPLMLLFAVGAVLLGIASKSFEKQAVTASVSTSAPSTENATDKIEKLSKLKKMLDSGIITQEEFDAKKKQLLGL